MTLDSELLDRREDDSGFTYWRHYLKNASVPFYLISLNWEGDDTMILRIYATPDSPRVFDDGVEWLTTCYKYTILALMYS